MKRHSKDKDRCIIKKYKKILPFENRIKIGKPQAKKKISNRILANKLVLLSPTKKRFKNQLIYSQNLIKIFRKIILKKSYNSHKKGTLNLKSCWLKKTIRLYSYQDKLLSYF
jgi:hypothetical protein